MTPEQHVTALLSEIDDPSREGLTGTPERHVKFLREFTTPEPFKMTTFDAEGLDNVVLQTGIPFYSLCEHHLVPFFGTAAVAYIPSGRIVGLSKLARTVDTCARRLQNQERITQQVADTLAHALNPDGIAVVLKARHLCMEMRGIRKPGAVTTTSVMHGRFREDAAARAELLTLIGQA